MQLPLRYVNERLIRELELLEPFGKGNTKPIFVEKNIEILSGEIIGRNKNVLKMQVRDESGTVLDAMYFGNTQQFIDYLKKKYGEASVKHMQQGYRSGMKMTFTYYPTINEYMGRKTIQIVIQNYQ